MDQQASGEITGDAALTNVGAQYHVFCVINILNTVRSCPNHDKLPPALYNYSMNHYTSIVVKGSSQR